MAATTTSVGLEGSRSGLRAAGAASRREEDDRNREREARRRARREAHETERLAYRGRAAEIDLAWRFGESAADAFGLHGQSLESSGGIFDNGDMESADAGRSFFDPALASARLHLGLREQVHRRALRRVAEIDATLAAIVVEGAVQTLKLAYTPHPAEPAVRDYFRRLHESVPVIERGVPVMRRIKRQAADERGGEIEDEIPLTVDRTKVSIVEIAIETRACGTGLGAWLLRREIPSSAEARREFLAWSVRQRHRDTTSANLLRRVLAEAMARVDQAVAAYVAVGERARDARQAEREIRAREARRRAWAHGPV